MSRSDHLFTPSGITLRQLQIFAVTAEAGSITTAAEQLFLSQTAVSLALRQLEKELGVTLLVRRRAHGITLTSTGKSLLPLGRNILASVADFGRSALDNGEVSGRVSVGCFPSLGPTMLPGLMEKFISDNPQADVQFVEANHAELMEMLEVGALDVVLTYRLGLPVGLIEKVVDVYRVGVLLATDHPLAANRDSIQLKELFGEPFIMLDTPVSQEHARQVFIATKVFPEVRFTTSSFETLRSLVGRNLGWSFTLQRPKTPTTHEGREVKILEIEDEIVPELPVVIARSPQLALSRATQAFINAVEDLYPRSVHLEAYPDLPPWLPGEETAPETSEPAADKSLENINH